MKVEWKNIIKTVINSIGILGSSVLIGILLLCLAYMLPTDGMRRHVSSDVELLQKEGNYSVFCGDVFVRMHPGNINVKTFFLNNRGMARDNLTDAIMLGNAVYDNRDKSILKKALGVYRYTDEGEMPISSLRIYLNEEKRDIGEAAYPRYWHGYLVILKPLLCIFTYSQIRIFNILLQSILLTFLSAKISRKTDWKYSICLIGGVLTVFPFVVPLCMQYSTATYVMLFSCIIYLDRMDYWKGSRSLFYFMVTGIITSYVDFLTYPIITLGGLLIIGVLATGERWGYIIKNSAMWCTGYFGMWFGKWIAASVILEENVVKDGLKQMLFRTSSVTETVADRKISALSAVFANFSSMTNIYYIVVFLLSAVFLISIVKKQQGLYKWKNIMKQGYFLWIALYPFIWYAVLKNHSYDHSSFTYRALFVTVFGLMVMIVRSCERIDGSDSHYFDKK